MDEKQKKIFQITEAVEKQINSLTSAGRTGKVLLTLAIELNLSQGFIGSVAITKSVKENIFK